MKTTTYTLTDGRRVTVEYDDQAPCRVCGLPVLDASTGGTDLCPWCDSGVYRDGEHWPARDVLNRSGSDDRRHGT